MSVKGISSVIKATDDQVVGGPAGCWRFEYNETLS
jgi:hypothetical protein